MTLLSNTAAPPLSPTAFQHSQDASMPLQQRPRMTNDTNQGHNHANHDASVPNAPAAASTVLYADATQRNVAVHGNDENSTISNGINTHDISSEKLDNTNGKNDAASTNEKDDGLYFLADAATKASYSRRVSNEYDNNKGYNQPSSTSNNNITKQAAPQDSARGIVYLEQASSSSTRRVSNDNHGSKENTLLQDSPVDEFSSPDSHEQAVLNAVHELVASTDNNNVSRGGNGAAPQDTTTTTTSHANMSDSQQPLEDDSSNDSSKDDEDSLSDDSWDTTPRADDGHQRMVRSKSVMEEDCIMDDSSPEKKSIRSIEFQDDSDFEQAATQSSTNNKFILPFDDSTDEDDSDFDPIHPTKLKKKRKRTKKPAKTDDSKKPASSSSVSNKRKKRNEKDSKRARLTASKSTSTVAPQNPARAPLKVGDRVFAEWAKNDWYWGIVTAVQRKKSSHYDQYAILFDDGDTLDFVSRRSIITVSKYRAFFGRHPPPLPQQEAEQSVATTLSPQEMYARRCQECELCQKPDCGSCTSCQNNKKRAASNDGDDDEEEMEVCLQKMCLTIPEDQKKQVAEGLPPGWVFLFKENRRYSNHKKVFILNLYIHDSASSKNSYRSVEAAIANFPKRILDFNPNAAADFYRHVGVVPPGATTESSVAVASLVNDSEAMETEEYIGSPMSLEELLECGCGECANCTKDDCGQCASCLSNRGSSSQVCLQKICCKISVERKAQPMPAAAKFPDGWKYIIDGSREGYSGNATLAPPRKNAHGLKIFAPNGTEYYSAERAKGHCAVALKEVSVEPFYQHVGIGKSGSQDVPVKRRSAPKDRDINSGNGRCGACENCLKEACGKCAKCLSNSSGTSRRCFQKMCYEIAVDEKAEAAVGFPSGWRFYFAENRNSGTYKFEPVPGLYILTEGNKRFRSVESAAAFCGLANESGIARKFYTHVGLPSYVPNSRTSSKPNDIESSLSKNRVVGARVYCMEGNNRGRWGTITEKKESGSIEYTFTVRLEDDNTLLEDLDSGSVLSEARYKSKTGKNPPRPPLRNEEDDAEYDSFSKNRVVGARVYCMEGSNRGRWGTITEKKESGDIGYTFTVRLEDDNTLLEDLDSGSVLSEAHYKSKTGKNPPRPPRRNDEDDAEYDSDYMEESPRKKQKTDGSSSAKSIVSTNHFLVGRKLCFAWNDLKNQSKIVYGQVVECEKNVQSGHLRTFKVEYSAQSREVANSISNGCAFTVPESQMLPASLVAGACIRFEQQVNPSQASSLLNKVGSRMLSWNWINPDSRKEELLNNADGRSLPRLTLVVRGFRLELTVKPSTIPNAGNGVFVRCTPLMVDDNSVKSHPFVLKPGELVDLGAYGPFRIQDKKLEAVFFAKNFIHNHKCEEWVFDSCNSRFQVDITDDVTGDIHSFAASHIPAYVNESNVDGAVCIRAEHDPEGSIHYLLGHAHVSQGDFVLPSDGTTEREVFVNYGEGYEEVRVRKGYSFLPDDKKAHLLKALAYEDLVDVKEMDRFGEAEIEATVDFLFCLFSTEAGFSSDAVRRALTVAVLLQHRAHNIFKEQLEEDDDAGTTTCDATGAVDMRKLLKLSHALVTLLLDMIPDDVAELKVLHAAGRIKKVFTHVLKMQFTKRELAKLADLME